MIGIDGALSREIRPEEEGYSVLVRGAVDEATTSKRLAADFDLLSVLLRLGNLLTSLGNDQLDVARVRHVRVNTTVGAVRASAHLRGVVDLNMSEVQVVYVQVVDRVLRVRLGVLQESQEELARLHGPSDLVSRSVVEFSHGVTSASSHVSLERNRRLLLQNILHVLDRLRQLHALDGLSDRVAFLEMNAQVRAAGSAALRLSLGTVSSSFSHDK